MTIALNVWGDGSSIAQRIEQDAYFIVRELGTYQRLVTTFNDASGMNLRRSYKYNAGTAVAIGDEDDLASNAFTPSADQTLTPSEIGLQFKITDARAESDLPEQIIADGARELGMAALDKVETDLYGLCASLTGGTVGAGTATITWGILGAGIAQARQANKSNSVPLVAVVHNYQWAVLAKAASIAGASVYANSPGFTEEVTRTGYCGNFMGVPIYQSYQAVTAGTAFYGAVFPRQAMAIDWRRPIRVRPQRDESARALEMNMSAIYAKGVWRPELGVQVYCLAETPSS
jgi:hypothetical protein